MAISLLSRTGKRGVRVVTDVGARCDGRRQRRARWAIAGRNHIRERIASAQDERRWCGRRSRVVPAPVAGVKFARHVRPDRTGRAFNPRTTVAKGIRHRVRNAHQSGRPPTNL